jgi:hypothetical protein
MGEVGERESVKERWMRGGRKKKGRRVWMGKGESNV